MSNRRRLLWTVPVALLIAVVAYTGWLVWRVQGDLQAAENSATRLRDTLDSGDGSARKAALTDLQADAASARQRTESAWWTGLTYVPFLGDDATGVRALSRSLDTVAANGVQPLSDTVDDLDGVLAHGRINVAAVRRLQSPVADAHDAFVTADADVSGLDSSGYAGPLKSRFDRYTKLIGDTAQALSSAQRATQVLPTMVGGDGPRDYLLIFQNNAEIRATGGLPGSWARIHAEDGQLSLAQQGTGSQFGQRPKPVLPLTPAERVLQHEQLGLYFLDAGFTPDYPRAAQLWTARWEETFPNVKLDGVVALDPVAMSYLLEGTGPVQVAGITLTSKNVVSELLNRTYRRLSAPAAQDAFFGKAAQSIFAASTDHLKSPLRFVEGLARAAEEGRFLVAASDHSVNAAIDGTRVRGALTADDGDIPHIDIGLNDATAAKMSYYLRYWGEVKSTGCSDGRQTLSGSLTLNQDIDPEAATKLPRYVTGGGDSGTDLGSQTVLIPIYGPYGGTINHISVNGKNLDHIIQTVNYRGRPATLVFADVSSRKDVVFNFTMHTGKGQTGAVHLGLTPSIVPGNNDTVSKSAC
ncbi:DUF4012 domain-containing protein [Nocardioides ungokensis]|uniref:DUF4012 domain-containing protein n=1 Tax=Nocardioides ungokensis TaxID=1643322 RepID=UPI0015DF33F3|nr:DUF4012 domain-containing protein [Nocardioides ungokensis]